MNETRLKSRKLRLIQWALIAAILVFAGIAEIARGHGRGDWTPWHWLVAGLAIWSALGGFRLRHRLLDRSMKGLTTDVSQPKALQQWEMGHVIGLAMARNSCTVWVSGPHRPWRHSLASLLVLPGRPLSTTALDASSTDGTVFNLNALSQPLPND